ncbi:hypothetical protein [Planomicrobium okeanokoites]|uniref:hypothetical protein n=1 Tax=Planomicrobium okeanokoites TaxID=244 RepID=UPI002493589B|nr:hypothetical protein [Planomicrobium okeanokoites]
MYSSYFNTRKATAPVQFLQALEGLIGMAVFAMKVKPEATRGTGPLESGHKKSGSARSALKGITSKMHRKKPEDPGLNSYDN